MKINITVELMGVLSDSLITNHLLRKMKWFFTRRGAQQNILQKTSIRGFSFIFLGVEMKLEMLDALSKIQLVQDY
jgi:hypothetical protein